jgi:glycosyltransferase involved in cell wall biosynthesis
MKIAIVDQPFGTIPLPWTGAGGSIDIWTYEIARRLARSCDVIVYTRKNRHQREVEYDQGVSYKRISTYFDEWYPLFSYALMRRMEKASVTSALARTVYRLFFFRNTKNPFFASTLYYLYYALQVAKDLRKEKCDIVHIFNFSQLAPIIRAFNPNAKIVLNMRCEWLTVLDERMIRRRLKNVDLIIGCSRYITKTIIQSFPELAERCARTTDTNGVDIDVFFGRNNQSKLRQNKEKRLLFVGRISPEKGIHVLLEAFKKVVERYPKIRLEIIGDTSGSLPRDFLLTLSDNEKIQNLALFYESGNSYFSYLQKQLHYLNIASKVTFTGSVPNLQMLDYYQAADILINPSFSESFGRSLIEAMACEVPVVASRVGGMQNTVENGKTGILVEPGDASALAEAILRLLLNDDLRISMGKASRKRVVKLFSWERVVNNLLFEYNNIRDADV